MIADKRPLQYQPHFVSYALGYALHIYIYIYVYTYMNIYIYIQI